MQIPAPLTPEVSWSFDDIAVGELRHRIFTPRRSTTTRAEFVMRLAVDLGVGAFPIQRDPRWKS